MNNFADTLLSLLFGWVRTLVESIWSSFSSGDMRNTISWLGDHWLLLVFFLCIGCTVLDYFIWFIRWKPYVIWSNKLRLLLTRTKSHDEAKEMYTFQHGYEQGVEMDFSDFSFDAPPEPEETAFSAWQYPETEQSLSSTQQPFSEQTQAFAPPVPEQNPAYESYPQPAYHEMQAAEASPVPSLAGTEMDAAEDTYLQPLPAYLPNPSVPRPRRSQRYEKKKSRLSSFLPTADEENEQLLDGLPPAVDQNEAFRAPVYPRQYNNQQG